MNHCGDCTRCCTLMQVPHLNKPACVTCTHVVEGGCGIYNTRPKECADFECIWLQTQKTPQPWPKRLRPDRCGVMFTPTVDPLTMAAHGDPVHLTTKPLAPRVKVWLSNGLKIVSVFGEKRKLLHWIKRV